MFNAKYLSSSYLSSLKEDFLSFYYIHIGKINDPLGSSSLSFYKKIFKVFFLLAAMETDFCKELNSLNKGDHQRNIPVKFG
jgi:hypothetical protein